MMQYLRSSKWSPEYSNCKFCPNKNSINRIAKQRTIRCLVFFIFLNISSHIKPVLNRRTPITRKSKGDQFTWLVNCIAMKGIKSRSGTERRMMINLLSCMVITIFLITKLKVLWNSKLIKKFHTYNRYRKI